MSHDKIPSPFFLADAHNPASTYAPAAAHALTTRRVFGRLALAGTLAAAGGLLPLTAAPAEDLTQLGSITRMQKISGATRGSESRSLTIGDKVYRHDLLWTRSRGQLRVDLADGSNLSLGENAEVALDDSMLSGGGSAFLRVLGGAFRFSSGGGEKAATPPKIETPFAVLSLRGTEVYGVKTGNAWGFLVGSGQVEVSNDSGSVILNEGEGTEVSSRSGKLEAPKKWGAAKVARTKAQLRF